MKTLVVRSPAVAARFIRSGEVAAFPTETVYGLGAALFDEAAIRKIFVAKDRPADNPLIAHVASIGQIAEVARDVPDHGRLLIERFFPGPLTVVLAKRPEVPLIATAGLDTIGVRMPSDATARAFLASCATPVAAPSANRSGRPSPTTWEAVRADLDGRIPCILAGDPTRVGLESTVVDCTGPVPTVLRAGAVSIEALADVVPGIDVAGRLGDDDRPRSPGLRHRHYAPRARVQVVTSPTGISLQGAAYIGLVPPPSEARLARTRVCADLAEYARELFAFFRACDSDRIPLIYCQRVPALGLGAAINDRISRAEAAFFSLEE